MYLFVYQVYYYYIYILKYFYMMLEKLTHIVPVRVTKSEFELLKKESIKVDRSVSFIARKAINSFYKK